MCCEFCVAKLKHLTEFICLYWHNMESLTIKMAKGSWHVHFTLGVLVDKTKPK